MTMRTSILLAMLLGTLILPPNLFCDETAEFTAVGVIEKPSSSSPSDLTPPEQTLTIGAGEEYNSNVNEKAHAQPDWVSIASTSGNLSYHTSRFKAAGDVDGTFNHYALGNRADEFKGNASALATLSIVPEFLFAEGNYSFRQVYSNLVRGPTNPTDSTKDQVNQNTATGRIYITPHLCDRLSLKIGTEATSIFYSTPDKNKQNYSAFTQSAYEITQNLKLTTAAEALRQNTTNSGIDKFVISAGFDWTYNTDGNLVAKVGPRYTSFSNGNNIIDTFFDARLTQKFGKFFINLNSSSTSVENPTTRYPTTVKKAGGAIGWDNDRLGIKANAAYSILDGQDTPRTEQVTLGLSATYALTPRLHMKVAGSQDFSTLKSGSQTRWYADGSLGYDLGKKFSVEGYFKWKLSDASSGGNNNYHVNIVGLRLKKTF